MFAGSLSSSTSLSDARVIFGTPSVGDSTKSGRFPFWAMSPLRRGIAVSPGNRTTSEYRVRTTLRVRTGGFDRISGDQRVR